LTADASRHDEVRAEAAAFLVYVVGYQQARVTQRALERYRAAVGTAGIRRRRAEQARAWMWSEVSETLTADLRLHPEVRRLVGGLERDVAAGRVTPAAAARQLLQIFLAR